MALGGQQALQRQTLITVEGFRGIRRASAPVLPLTIVTGRNNSGKSSLIEALAIVASGVMKDWLGNDIVRHVIDSKLLGRPTRLLNTDAESARIVLEDSRLGVELRLQKPGTERARELACRAVLDGVWASRLAFCTYIALPGRDVQGGEIGRLSEVFHRLADMLQVQCGKGKPAASQPDKVGAVTAAIAETLLEGMTRAAAIVLKESIEATASVDASGATYRITRIYYPGVEYRKLLSKKVRKLLLLASHEALEKAVEALGIDGLDVDEAANCMATTLQTLLMEAARLRAPGGRVEWHRDGAPWRVFVLFHRSLLGGRRGLAQSLTEAVRGLHELGLLDTFNSLVKSMPELEVSDPFIEEGEVWFRTPRGRVPTSLLGDGTLHLLLLLAGLALARSSRTMLVCEEPETGLHPGYIEVLAAQLVETIRENPEARVVLTTHSLELIKAVARAAAERGLSNHLATILMDRGEVFSIFRGEEVVEASRLEIDLRGV